MTAHDASATITAPPRATTAREDDASRVERALDWLSRNFERQPSLTEAAGHAGLSEHHFQRLFGRQVGLSPKKYVQFLTLERAKEVLAQSRSVLDAAYVSGLSGPGRLHDLFVNVEAMTPGEFKHRGRGLVIRYGEHPSPFGRCLIMRTARGVCGLAFASPGQSGEALAELASASRRRRSSRIRVPPPASRPRFSVARRAAATSRCICAAPRSRSRSGARCWRSRRGASPPTATSPVESERPAHHAPPAPQSHRTRSPGSFPATG